jgi:hypothetical protein
MKWWGYIHENGTVQVKRFFSPLDIMDAEESPFCKEVFGPFEATGREDAVKQINNLNNGKGKA